MSRQILQRAGWGVADQALSSLTNFALGLFVARSVTPAGFGAFSIVFTTFHAALGLSRAMTSEPLMVRYSVRAEADWRSGTALATGVALALGLALGAGCVLVGRIAGGVLAEPFMALGLTLPGLLVQDCWRYAFFAKQDGSKAVVNDAVYAVVLLPAFATLLSLRRPSVGALVLAWGGAATVAALVGIVQAKVSPAPRRVVDWWKHHRDLIPRYLGEFAVGSSGSQLSVYGVGIVAGLEALGSLRAGYLLFGPLQVLYMGVYMVAVPELMEVLRRSPRRLPLAGAAVSCLLAVTALAWGVIIVLTPTSVGTAVLGPMWGTAHLIAIPVTLQWIGSGMISGAAAAIRALAAATRGLVARVVDSFTTVTGPVCGAALGGGHGAAWGGAVNTWVANVFWWWQLHRALREYESPIAVNSAAPVPSTAST